MYEVVAHPASLTPAETLILRAMLTHTYGYGDNRHVMRPADSTLKIAWNGSRSVQAFQSYCYDQACAGEWLARVAVALSEDRVGMPKHPTKYLTWEEALVAVRNLVTAQFEAEKTEAQDCLDESPEDFKNYHTSCMVVDGKVIDPWGKSLSGPVFWWLDNATLVGTWLVYQTVADAITEHMSEELLSWTFSEKHGSDPRRIAAETFSHGMRHLYEDILEQDILTATQQVAE